MSYHQPTNHSMYSINEKQIKSFVVINGNRSTVKDDVKRNKEYIEKKDKHLKMCKLTF